MLRHFYRFAVRLNYLCSELPMMIQSRLALRIRSPLQTGLLRIALVVIALASCTMLAINTRARFAPAKSPSVPVEGAIVTLRSFGFEPKELTRKAGPVFFFVNNASGFRQVNFRLDREVGARLKNVPLPQGRFRWQEVVNLTPGTYLLTVAENPQWVCHITITAR